MEHASVELDSGSGIFQVAAKKRYYSKLTQMFKEREDLSKIELSIGEIALGCRRCGIHGVEDSKFRPAVVDPSEVDTNEFDEVDPDSQALFILCPALVLALEQDEEEFPCQEMDLLPIFNT